MQQSTWLPNSSGTSEITSLLQMRCAFASRWKFIWWQQPKMCYILYEILLGKTSNAFHTFMVCKSGPHAIVSSTSGKVLKKTKQCVGHVTYCMTNENNWP